MQSTLNKLQQRQSASDSKLTPQTTTVPNRRAPQILHSRLAPTTIIKKAAPMTAKPAVLDGPAFPLKNLPTFLALALALSLTLESPGI